MTDDKLKMAMEKMGMGDQVENKEAMAAMNEIFSGTAKVANMMKEKGMTEEQIMEHMKKITDTMMDKDMMTEMAR